MACSYGRAILLTCRRSISYSAPRYIRRECADPLEHATGIEKREKLAHLAGEEDPFNLNVTKRGPGTKECPNLVPSAFNSRLVGCICEEDHSHINWMWLHQGTPRRCECGYWFKLVEKAPV
ncbi:PREDICTED: cytochrome c oxidase subunit 5B, mitochondrial-like [Polistes dominula]|uniref:Cytochrome c oxidase subunit 5B, mitochondrial-like n=1 Tax=Polistes dominula TaxID=743375 RepID=A0ABM1J8U6_POLDO|nr:PREDICTED: cytochrome c oxidase subunit 5B, mitochondrial-like [Polistes dominula]